MKKTPFLLDYYRMTGKRNRKTLLFDFLFRHNVRWAFYYRRYQAGHHLSKIALYLLSRKYGIEVSNTARIGHGIYLGHPYNITIGSNVVIGDNVNLHKGCTVGSIMSGSRAGSPVIGNCVFVGINATVVGGITIGDDVMIAPNAFVNFDVPSHSVVVGNPGMIHPKQDATKNYIILRV